MHEISVITGNITSTSLGASKEVQSNSQASSSRGSLALNQQQQDELNQQAQAAVVDINTDIGGITPDPWPATGPGAPYDLPWIFSKTTQVTAQSMADNQQGQGLFQSALIKENYGTAGNASGTAGPLAHNQGLQNQLSDQQSDSDITVKSKIGEAVPEPAPVPVNPAINDPQVIVDETMSGSQTSNLQEQFGMQAAEVRPQQMSQRQPKDPAINELGQNQLASKRTNARNTTAISVAPGGRHDPWRIGVGPTDIQATRTVADAGSQNQQAQGYDQTAVANSGYTNELAENTATSVQEHGSETAADNSVDVVYRTNTVSPLTANVLYHAASAADNSLQTQDGSQASASSGWGSRSRNLGAGMQSNGQLVTSRMSVSIDV